MACLIPYINKTNLSQTEKERLANIHNNIGEQALSSKAFHKSGSNIVTYKHKYNKATNFISNINKLYGVPVARLAQITATGVNNLNVNVLPLSKEIQGELFEESFNEERISFNEINYQLKAIELLRSDKAKELWDKGITNDWTLSKFLDELGGFGKNSGNRDLFTQEQLDSKLNKSQKSSLLTKPNRFYRVVNVSLGNEIGFLPTGFHEEFIQNDKGDWIPQYNKYGGYWKSKIPETSASKSIGGAVLGAWTASNQNINQEFYIYEITDSPDLDISNYKYYDFSILQEVRYRKPVVGKLIGKVVMNKELQKVFSDEQDLHNEDSAIDIHYSLEDDWEKKYGYRPYDKKAPEGTIEKFNKFQEEYYNNQLKKVEDTLSNLNVLSSSPSQLAQQIEDNIKFPLSINLATQDKSVYKTPEMELDYLVSTNQIERKCS